MLKVSSTHKDLLISALIITFISVTMQLLAGCSSKSYQKSYHGNLVNQRLTPRTNFVGLTHQIKDENDEWSQINYDLKDPGIRETLFRLRFACNIVGKRWRICKNRAGYCRRENYCPEWVHSWWRRNVRKKPPKCKDWIERTDFISVEKHTFLIAAGTECQAGW